MSDEPTREPGEHVLVFAPRRDDAADLCRTLGEAGLASRAVASVDELIERLEADDAGAVLLSEDSLTTAVVARLVESLEVQSLWSDVPVVVLTSGEQDAPGVAELRLVCALVRLDGAAQRLALVPTMESALRARRRQYEVRDRLAELRAGQQPRRDGDAGNEFLAWVGHELQTPVSAILLWSRMIASGIVPAHDLPRALASIESSARTQSYQIHDLLDASRLATGRLQLNLRPAPLAPALEAAVQVARSLADGKKVRLALSLDPSTGPALADPDRVQRIVWNLLLTVVRSTADGGEVHVALEPDESWVRITVSSLGDEPSGPPSSLTPPGSSAAPSSDRARLGLRLCQDLVELHGGTLEVTVPTTGKGGGFAVRLPAATPAS